MYPSNIALLAQDCFGYWGFYFHLNFRNPLPMFYEEFRNSDGNCIKCAGHFQQHGASFYLPVSSVSFFNVPKLPLWESFIFFIFLARFILSYVFFFKNFYLWKQL